MKKLFISASLALTLLFGGYAQAATFADVGTNWLGLSQGWMAWGDCNKEGRLDVIAADMDGGWNNQTLLYSNAGNDTFVQVSTDLVNWVGLSTNLAFSNSLPLSDPDTAASRRFYRAFESRQRRHDRSVL